MDRWMDGWMNCPPTRRVNEWMDEMCGQEKIPFSFYSVP
jgi:hypothetical protein